MQNAKTLSDFIRVSAEIYPDKTALIYENEEFSYQKIKESVDAVGSFFVQHTKKGDVIAVLLPNSPEFIFTYFGILKAGCIALLLPPNISDKSLQFQIEKTDPEYIVSQETFQNKIQRTPNASTIPLLEPEKLFLTEEVANREVTEDDISTIIFTSGTTSAPKGVTLRHRNVVNATKNIIEFLKWDNHTIDLNISPLSHSFGLGHIHSVFAVGGTTVLFRDAINLKKIINTIREKNVTTFGAVPAILRLLTTHFLKEFIKHGSNLKCIHTNTSLLEPKLINALLTHFPQTDFSYYYGLSEASRSTFITFNKHPDKLKSVGSATPNVLVEIHDKEDNTVQSPQIGEICIKGEHVIDSYWKNPDASKRIRNGWLHTGDMGYLDKDGFLFFQGRKDDIINVSGEKVSPEEVEMYARTFKGVSAAAAIGNPDKFLGEVVKLFIVVEDQSFNTNDLMKYLRGKLENYKVPRSIEIINEIPKTENGKLIRSKLKNTYKQYD